MEQVRRFFGSRARRILGTLTEVITKDPIGALTFDDGPHPEFTPRVLEILRRHQAHATFFMVGAAAQKHQDIVRLVAQEGHAIGSHSWEHRSFLSLSSRERRQQMCACEQVLPLQGERLFRPPYGIKVHSHGLMRSGKVMRSLAGILTRQTGRKMIPRSSPTV